MKEEFQHQITVIGQTSLKAPHTSDSLLIQLRIHMIHQHIVTDLRHPAGIHKQKSSRLRNLLHKTRQERLTLLLRGRRMHRYCRKKAGIKLPDHTT